MKINIDATILNMRRHLNEIFSDISVVEGNKSIILDLNKYKNKYFESLNLKIILKKEDISANTISWRWITNPENNMISEKVSRSDRFILDIIKTVEYLNFDDRYIESLNFVRSNDDIKVLDQKLLERYRRIKESYSPSISYTSSSNSSAGSKKVVTGGIGFDIIGSTLIVY